MKVNKLLSVVLAVAMLLTLCVTAYAEELPPTEPPVTVEGTTETAVPEVTAQSIANMKVSEYATLDSDSSRKKVDAGHIYVGYAIEGGVLNTANSNWTTVDTSSIVFSETVEGEGFTALYATGKGTDIKVTGSLNLTDSSNGQYASDFTGTGTVMVVNDYAKVEAIDMTVNTKGFVRAAAIVYNSAELTIRNSNIATLGANPLTDAYEGYTNSANTSKMISPPWVLGIQGGIRTVNVLGTKATLNVIDSTLASGGWGVLSSDGCTSPVFNVVDSTLKILPEAEGGMNSGWNLFGYDADKYGSGYGSYVIGNVTENFYGANITGATFGCIAREGTAIYASSNGPITLYNAYGEQMETVDGKGAASVINTVFGCMTHASQDAGVSYTDGTVVNSEEATFLFRSSNTATFKADNAQLNPKNGVILQMIDDDDTTVGGFSPFNSYLYEDAGMPSKTGNVTGPKGNEQVLMTVTNGVYTGDFLNGTGYYAQGPDILDLTIGSGAEVHGDVALTETFHGMVYSPAAAAVLDSFGNDVDYVFLDKDYNITDDLNQIAFIQFTQFSIRQYYMLCHLLNHVYYNGDSAAMVTVSDGGKWFVEGESLITYLSVDADSEVHGVIVDNGDGSFTLTPGDDVITDAVYGEITEVTASASTGIGGMPGGMGGGMPGASAGSQTASAPAASSAPADLVGPQTGDYNDTLIVLIISLLSMAALVPAAVVCKKK